MGEGLGAGGTPPGVVNSTLGRRGRFLRAKLFSGSSPPPAPPALRARAMPQIDGQIDMPAIGKFDISQMDAKSSLAAAAALDHIARANREPAGQIICERGHVKNPPRKQQPSWNLPLAMPDERDSSETARRSATISVNRCGQAVPARNRAARITMQDAIGCLATLVRRETRRRGDRRLQFKDRSRCPGPRP